MNYQVNLLRELHDKVVRGEPALIGSALQDAAHEIDRSFSMLEILGVSPARAGSVANGIDVLHTRMSRESQDLRADNERLRAALKDLSRAYVSMMETGRDRIIAMGGDCDPVDVMERGDPYLRKAREALGESPSVSQLSGHP